MYFEKNYNNGDVKSKLVGSLMGLTDGLSVNQIGALLTLAEKYSYSVRQKPECSYNGLSARELEVLVLLANGYTRKNIGESLGISKNTAARHISNIYRKLGVSSVAEATQYAYSNRLCFLPSTV